MFSAVFNKVTRKLEVAIAVSQYHAKHKAHPKQLINF
jgi:hypothetical protein